MSELKVKRIYDAPDAGDGYRVLIDRLWPRGVKKEAACLDEWNRDIAPTPDLRRWFGHKPENFAEFAQRYQAQLHANPQAAPFAAHVHELLAQGNVTLLYGAKSPTCNHALVLRQWLLSH